MAKINRRRARVVKIGKLKIGGNYPVAIQSMVKCPTAHVGKVCEEIRKLDRAGCEIVRLAVKDIAAARAIRRIKKESALPIVADIHFDWKLAIEAINNGADKIRLNPGNIRDKARIREVVKAAKASRIPIRIGVNSGSLVRRPSSSSVNNMVRSALDYVRLIERAKFHDLVISLKGSNIPDTVEAYQKISKCCDYPLHLGVTATGLPQEGMIKSSIAIGTLLLGGIGDTIRVSLTATPVEEVKVAKSILMALGLRNFGHEIISCPTCGRCEVDLVKLTREFENRLNTYSSQLSTGSLRPVKVALMGCVVNGPGEAKEADIGVAFGKEDGLLFKDGKAVRKVSFNNCLDNLIKEIKRRDSNG